MLQRCYYCIAKEEKNTWAQLQVKWSCLCLGQESGRLLTSRIRKRIQIVKMESSGNTSDLITCHLALIWVRVAGAKFFWKTQTALFPATVTESFWATPIHWFPRHRAGSPSKCVQGQSWGLVLDGPQHSEFLPDDLTLQPLPKRRAQQGNSFCSYECPVDWLVCHSGLVQLAHHCAGRTNLFVSEVS